MKTNNEIRKVVESMSLDELCGQVLNIDLASPDFEISEYDGIFKEMHLGSVYTAPVSPLCKGMNQLEMNRTLCKRAGEYARMTPSLWKSTHGFTRKCSEKREIMCFWDPWLI